MAITGCDFVCKNEDCQHYKSGVVLTSPWPLGDIDRVMNSKNVIKNTPFQEELRKMKEQGRKYACITLPNTEKILTVGYRVHMWCAKCPCLWTYDAMIPKNYIGCDSKTATDNDIIMEAILNANIPENCPTCNNKLKTFAELIDDEGDGIQCTSCHTKLQNNVWFSNEEGPSEKLNPVIIIPEE